jgi:hypothetical protein
MSLQKSFYITSLEIYPHHLLETAIRAVVLDFTQSCETTFHNANIIKAVKQCRALNEL